MGKDSWQAGKGNWLAYIDVWNGAVPADCFHDQPRLKQCILLPQRNLFLSTFS